MAFNLMDVFKDQVQGALVQQASSFLGESESGIKSAMDIALPGIMGGLINKGTSVNGASSILDFLNNNNMDGSMMNSLGGLFSGGSSTDGLMSTGSMVMKFLMGDKVGALTDFIVSKAGIKGGTAASLIKMAAPMVLGMLGKHVSKNGLNASGLMNLLLGQKEHVAKAAPAGLGSLLGFPSLSENLSLATDNVKSAASTAAAAASERVSNIEGPSGGGGGFGRILPWLIGLGAILGILWFTSGGGCSAATDAVGDAANKTGDMIKEGADAVGDAAGDVVDATGNAVDATGKAIGDAADAVGEAFSSISLPGGEEIKFEVGSFTDRMARYLQGEEVEGIKDGIIAFDKVNFDTGKATLTADSRAQLINLATILKAYPNVEIEVGGHTDNTGDDANNMTLSQQRALSVKKAVTEMGVNQSRISAKGYGETQPIASNDTAEGRAENRRVVARITKK